MTPEDTAALDWYGNLIITEVLPCPICGAGAANMSSSARKHKEWHEARGESGSV